MIIKNVNCFKLIFTISSSSFSSIHIAKRFYIAQNKATLFCNIAVHQTALFANEAPRIKRLAKNIKCNVKLPKKNLTSPGLLPKSEAEIYSNANPLDARSSPL